MAAPFDIAEQYLGAQRSFVALARSLTDDEWATATACCPGWTVRDVLSHVAGLADDLVHGRVEGAATDPWTAAQVERWRDAAVDELVAQWDAQAPGVADALAALGEARPVFDCCTHEHDVRAALGRPGNRDAAIVSIAAATLADLDGVRVVFDGAPGAGASSDESIVRGLTPFELFRSRLGRRSAAQVRAYDWSVPPDDEVLATWFAFGPSPHDIDE